MDYYHLLSLLLTAFELYPLTRYNSNWNDLIIVEMILRVNISFLDLHIFWPFSIVLPVEMVYIVLTMIQI